MLQSELGNYPHFSSALSFTLPPIAESDDTGTSIPSTPPEYDTPGEQARKLRQLHETFKAYMLGVTYAANTGGTATLMGTTANMIMKGYADE